MQVAIDTTTAVSDALRRLEWVVAEDVGFSGGTLDVSAQRRYERVPLGARIRLAVFSDAVPPRELAITETATVDVTLASYALGDDDRAQRETIGRVLAPHVDSAAALTALHAAAYPHERSLVLPCRVSPPPAHITASRIADLDTTVAFAAIDAIRADLLAFDLDVIVDDLTLIDDVEERAAHASTSLAFRAASCDLLHVVLVTTATLPAPSVRLVQTTLTGGEPRWIDVVQSAAAEEYFEKVTSHYDAQFRRRQFTRG
jgi:hypothetical protein